MLAKKFVLNTPYQGEARLDNFKLVEEVLPELKDGEILCKGEWHSVDPYMKFFGETTKPGDTIPGSQVARVIRSKNAEYPEGSQVLGRDFGWRNLTVYKPGPKSDIDKHGIAAMRPLVDMRGLPDSYALGAVGMPGNTAYFGFSRVCDPKPGETVVVSAAAGAVGSLVGQIAKIRGCKVIGFAGSDDKVQWIKETLGFDHAFNYKNCDVFQILKACAPQGVDCYFDNVGGEFSYHVVRNMNKFGRIGVCGAISSYNSEPNKPPLVPMDYVSLVYKSIKMDGFLVSDYYKEWYTGLHQMRDWILEGKIKIEETVVDGFENMPKAFIELLQGKNTGKMVVKA